MSSTAARIHPGILRRTEFFEPLSITQRADAKATGNPQNPSGGILAGRGSIAPDTAAGLGRYVRLHPRTWLNHQVAFDH